DNVQYAELMDFCYVWLRRLVGRDIPYFDTASTRTDGELTGNKTAGRGLDHFCDGLSRVYCAAARALKPGGLFAFTYHHNDPEAYLPVAVALLDAGLTATASLPCPAEMAASLHIARTSSSVVDTILCARKALPRAATSALAVSDLPHTLHEQAAQLRAGGVEPSAGDLRCMALGLVTVIAVNQLSRTWSAAQPAARRLARVRTVVDTTLKQLGGLDRLADTRAYLKNWTEPGSRGAPLARRV
ncbi:MAG: DNA methylase, partial [Myxococcota bacterium]